MKGGFLFKLLFGGFFIFLGLGFLFDQVLNIDFGNIMGLFWPVAVMIVGLYFLIRRDRHIILGLIIFSIGSVLLIGQFFDLPFSIWNLWPLILVFIGIKILFRGDKEDKWMSNSVTEGDTFESNAVFWGESKKVRSDNLKSGKITTIFGGSEIDLREAKIDKDGATIEVMAAFGGSVIKVNEKHLVKSDGFSGVIGGFEDKSRKSENPDGVIILKGSATFGGVEVTN